MIAALLALAVSSDYSINSFAEDSVGDWPLPPYGQNYTASVAEAHIAALECPVGMVMDVLQAEYGSSFCAASKQEMQSAVNSPCNGRSYCKFNASTAYFTHNRCPNSDMASAEFSAIYQCSSCMPSELDHWACHTVVKGETIMHIALQYAAEPAEVADMNARMLKTTSSLYNTSWFPPGFIFKVPDRRACEDGTGFECQECVGPTSADNQCDFPAIMGAVWNSSDYTTGNQLVDRVRSVWNSDKAHQFQKRGPKVRIPTPGMINSGAPACIPAWYEDVSGAMPAAERYDCYQAVQGDTMGAIGAKYASSIMDLRAANPLMNLGTSTDWGVHTGVWFKIPRTCQPVYTKFPGDVSGDWCYKVRSGDDIWGIGRAFGVSPSELCDVNGGSACSGGDLQYESVELLVPASPRNECSPSKGCNVCAKCCLEFIPDGANCDACMASCGQ
jgi:hypothetical protein